jgi:hypothetical protein
MKAGEISLESIRVTMTRSFELRLAFLTCSLLAALFVVYALLGRPSGGQPLGHALGIVGTLLMVTTETLYSIRKRTTWLRSFGPVRWWLSAHIFTGIVGPFMVLTHTAFEFRGLAGFTMLLAVIVVASGFIGRYFYTAIPRSLAGAEASDSELKAEIGRVQQTLAEVAGQRSAAVKALVEADQQRQRMTRGDIGLVILRSWDEWRYRSRLHSQVRKVERAEKQKLSDIERMLMRRRSLERQMRMLEGARRLLSVWHVAHVPMGLALFAAAAIHVAATLYFRAGLWA